MKKILSLLLVALMIFSVVGCAKQAAPEEAVTEEVVAPEGESEVVEEPAITRGGVLKAGKTNAWSSLNPTQSNSRKDDRFVLGLVYESLLSLDENGAIQPGLAESYEVVDDLTIKMKLREDVVFHDGTPFNAEAAAYNLNWYITEECNHYNRSEIVEISNVEVVSEYEIQINLASPSATVIYALADVCGYMISPAAVEKYGDDLAYNTCGTGPFMVKEAVEGSYINFEKNPNYYKMGEDGQALPYLDGVELSIITDDTIKTTNLISGNIQLVDYNNSVASTETLFATPDIVTNEREAATIYAMVLNGEDKVLADKNVRLAIQYAINREEMSQVMAGEYGSVPVFISSTAQWYYSDVGGYTYSPDKVAALLEGYTAEDLTFTLSYISREPDATFVQVVQQQLAAVGITINLEPLERLAWVNKFSTEFSGQIGTLKLLNPRADAYMQLKDLMTYTAPSLKETFVADLNASKALYDQDERKAALYEWQKAFQDCAYVVYLYGVPTYVSYAESVNGIIFRPDSTWNLEATWIK